MQSQTSAHLKTSTSQTYFTRKNGPQTEQREKKKREKPLIFCMSGFLEKELTGNVSALAFACGLVIRVYL